MKSYRLNVELRQSQFLKNIAKKKEKNLLRKTYFE